MKKRSVTGWLADYIARNQISTKQVAKDTGILEAKLLISSTKTLNATEFLELCSYLQIQPEYIYGEMNAEI